MKYGKITATLLTALLFACNKDKFTTNPQVNIKSISPSTVFNGDIIDMKGNFTDDEGDVDSAFVVYKWYNGTTVVRNDTFRYTITGLGVPVKTRQADFTLSFEYNTSNNADLVTLPGVSVRDTTATFGIILLDKKKNRSEYRESEKIRLKKT